MKQGWLTVVLIMSLCCLSGCDEALLNDPYPHDQTRENILYTAFSSQPKTLDPVRSYAADEYQFISQIYEPPYQYHYLHRPYQVVPLTATEMPEIHFYDKHHHEIASLSAQSEIAYTTFIIRIKENKFYEPHPAFAKDKAGNFYYHAVNSHFWQEHHFAKLSDFPHQSTRALTADDYVYQLKRMALPDSESPIFGLMEDYLRGFRDYAHFIQKVSADMKQRHPSHPFVDLRLYPFEGAKALDDKTYQITINGYDPQFIYWLTMPFFSPIPWEVDYFYSQSGMKERNIGFNWYPVGTGPYRLTVNNPNSKMILEKNPNFSGELYPSDGSEQDRKQGLLENAGKPLPFIHKIIFSLEKETIPYWNKFLQGYYDLSGVAADSFDQAIRLDPQGKAMLTREMLERQLHLRTSPAPTIFYYAFNMQDKIVGGYNERARLLRQAISIAVNIEEYIAIFLNGRGIPAHQPIPPAIFGYENPVNIENINPIIYQISQGDVKRRNLADAKKLLAKAGYPEGIDENTGEPLILNYDVPTLGSPDQNSQLEWFRHQFAKLGIQLHIRASEPNRFQDMVNQGKAQIYAQGWNADYPDAENFFFLFYGPNGVLKSNGMNTANYDNPQFNALYDKMKDMHDSPERLEIIKKMNRILQKDNPWIWGYYPITYTLSHDWVRVASINDFGNNTLKYVSLKPQERLDYQQKWNQALFSPVVAFGFFIILLILIVIREYRKKRNQSLLRP